MLRASFPFQSPRRIEDLIHLQLFTTRRRIIICSSCGSTHLEWFEIDADDAVQVVQEWYSVVTKESLYTGDGELTKPWLRRISSGPYSINARQLLQLPASPVKPVEEKTTPSSQSLQSPTISTPSKQNVLPADKPLVPPPKPLAEINDVTKLTAVTPESESLPPRTSDAVLSIFEDFVRLVRLLEDRKGEDTIPNVNGHDLLVQGYEALAAT